MISIGSAGGSAQTFPPRLSVRPLISKSSLAKDGALRLSPLAMADFTLEALLARARDRRMTAQERHEQKISFVVGNETVEGQPIHRGTVTMAVRRKSSLHRPTVSSAFIQAPAVPYDVDGPIRQFQMIQALVERSASGDSVAISPALVRELHGAAGDRSGPIFGTYREVAVEVLGSLHRPLGAELIAEAVEALCDHLNARWTEEDAISLSAFSLWRLNWIHPFLDGNGRTARALCYLVLNLKLGMLIPGSPTLIEQLKERRDEYFDALTVADLSFARRGEADLVPLKRLLEVLLLRQLRSMPALSQGDEAQLAEIVSRRIEQLNPALRERLFDSAEVAYRSWSTADYFLVHVGPTEALDRSEELFSRTEQPFPGLLAAPGEPAVLTLAASQRGAIVRPRTFEVSAGAALWLEPNAAVAMERPAVLFRQDGQPAIDWALDGTLYIMRRGDEINDLWAFDVFDSLVTRHIQEAH